MPDEGIFTFYLEVAHSVDGLAEFQKSLVAAVVGR